MSCVYRPSGGALPRLHSLPYRIGVLLCVAAILAINCRRVETFALAQALLRATLDRSPAPGTTDDAATPAERVVDELPCLFLTA